jgi:flagellar basal body-associated protein FliL
MHGTGDAMKKLIIFGGIGLLLLMLLGGGAWFFLKSGPKKPLPEAAEGAKAEGKDGKEGAAKDAKGGKEDDDEEEAPAKGGEGEGASGPAVMTLNRLIVNLEGRKNAFLKCDIHILFRNQELGKLAASDKPTPENSLIRSMVLEAISGKTVEAASDLETRETIRQEIKDKLNEKFANKHSKEELEKAKKSGKPVKPPIKDVLVVDWALQQ